MHPLSCVILCRCARNFHFNLIDLECSWMPWWSEDKQENEAQYHYIMSKMTTISSFRAWSRIHWKSAVLSSLKAIIYKTNWRSLQYLFDTQISINRFEKLHSNGSSEIKEALLTKQKKMEWKRRLLINFNFPLPQLWTPSPNKMPAVHIKTQSIYSSKWNINEIIIMPSIASSSSWKKEHVGVCHSQSIVLSYFIELCHGEDDEGTKQRTWSRFAEEIIESGTSSTIES